MSSGTKLEKGHTEPQDEERRNKLGQFQRMARDKGIPIIVVFEGWDPRRMAPVINNFLHPLDPRGFTYHVIAQPDDGERARPFMWRFWTRTPTHERIAIFDRSWYSRTVIERTDRGKSEVKAKDLFEINEFERTLTNSGVLLMKFFLDIGKEPNPKKKDPFDCEVLEEDREIMEHHGRFSQAYERLIKGTNMASSPWTIITEEKKDLACAEICSTFISKVDLSAVGGTVEDTTMSPTVIEGPIESVDRTKLDLNRAVQHDEYKKRLEKYQKEMRSAQCRLIKKNKRLIIVFEGRDASGKGGSIARITSDLNPRTYHVSGITAPNDVELAHHYLWRFHMCIPPVGHISIFDRSWYGRVLVERVEKFTAEKDWKRGYHEINMFEKMLYDNDSIIVKLWLEIDKSTQLERFNDRQSCPLKLWKITKDDWTARERWDQYSLAIDDMLQRTSTSYAPWTIVEANNKEYARLRSFKTILEAIDNGIGPE